MPTFEFTDPGGKSYSVDGPDGATPEQAFQILQSHLGGSSDAVDKSDPRFSEGSMASAKALEGVPFLGALTQKAGAAVSALAHPLTGVGSDGATLGERYSKNLSQENAASDAFEKEHPIESGVSKAIGCLLYTSPSPRDS